MPRHPTAPPLELWVPFLLALVVVVVVVVVGPLPGTAHSGSDTSSPCDLLLSSVNGVVFHVDVITGTILSRIDTRSPMVKAGSGSFGGIAARDLSGGRGDGDSEGEDGDDSPSSSEEENFMLIPSVDGNLFLKTRTAGLQRMPLSVKDIVHRSPFRGGDGSLYVGARKSKLFQSGTHTGTDEETDLFATSDPIRGTTDGSLSSPHRMISGRSIPSFYVLRTDYFVSSFNTMDSQQRWNMSFAEFDPSLSGKGSASHCRRCSELAFLGTRDGTLLVIDKRTGEQVSEIDLAAIPVAVYMVNGASTDFLKVNVPIITTQSRQGDSSESSQESESQVFVGSQDGDIFALEDIFVVKNNLGTRISEDDVSSGGVNRMHSTFSWMYHRPPGCSDEKFKPVRKDTLSHPLVSSTRMTPQDFELFMQKQCEQLPKDSIVYQSLSPIMSSPTLALSDGSPSAHAQALRLGIGTHGDVHPVRNPAKQLQHLALASGASGEWEDSLLMTSSDDVAYSGALSMLPIGVADSRELLQVGIPGDKGFQTAHQVVDSSSDTAARRDADAPEHFSVALAHWLLMTSAENPLVATVTVLLAVIVPFFSVLGIFFFLKARGAFDPRPAPTPPSPKHHPPETAPSESPVKGVDSSTEGSSSHLEETPVSKPGTVEGSKKPEGSSHTPSKRGRSKKTSNRGRGKAEHRPLNADASSSRGSVSVGSRSVEGKGLGSSVSGTSLGGAAPVASTRDATPSVEVDSPQRGAFLAESEVTPDGITRVGSLQISSEILGYGKDGTVVFAGSLGGRDVAVKRMLLEFFDVTDREIQILIQSDAHPNVVRYFAKESDGQFVYLVLEKCQGTLGEFDKLPAGLRPEEILREASEGIAHLHSLNIVHRDIKPANILIGYDGRLKISDMGTGKILSRGQTSFQTAQDYGTFGWQAPEILRNERMTQAMDIFSLGCVFFYILSGGRHPFGEVHSREHNILRGKADLTPLVSMPLARNLVHQMLYPDPSARPTMQEVQKHPYFWSAERKIFFLQNVSEELGKERKAFTPIWEELSIEGPGLIGHSMGWGAKLDAVVFDALCSHRNYDTSQVTDLLRCIRNFSNHFREYSPQVLELTKAPEGIFHYFFEDRFPALYLRVYELARKHWGHREEFAAFF